MELEILSPDKKIYTGEIKLVKLPGSKGSFEVLKNHAPIISTLEKGQIKVIDINNDIQHFEISDGVVEVLNNKIIGYSTSSNYSFNYKKNIFLAYVKADLDTMKKLTIEIEGKKYELNHEKECLHDPSGEHLRN